MEAKRTCNEFVALINGGDFRGTVCCTCGEKESSHGAVTFEARLEAFRALVEQETKARYETEWHTDQAKGRIYRLEVHAQSWVSKIKMGRKYANVDVGESGKYMVELSTGNIYGIKAYGVIHRGHYFGTLDTINDYDWSGYRAIKRQQQAA